MEVVKWRYGEREKIKICRDVERYFSQKDTRKRGCFSLKMMEMVDNLWNNDVYVDIETRPDTLPGISRVSWAGAVMLKNRRKKSADRPTDGRTDRPTDGHTLL